MNRRVLALGVIGYTLLLRGVYLGVPELLHEEAYYWNYAQHLDISYLDHPPAVAWIIHLGTMVFGDTEFGVRIGAYVCWLIAAFFSYRLTYKIFNKSDALKALMLVAVLPIFFGVGLVMTPDAPLIACWSATLFFLHEALVEEHRHAWLGVGVCLGLGLLSKYTIALLGPAMLIFGVVDIRSRRWFLKPGPYVAVGIALALFSPVILWNFHHEWASFLFQGPRRVTGGFNFSLHELIGSILVLLTPTGLLAAFSILIFRKTCRAELRFMPKGSIHRSYSFGMVFLLVPLSVFLMFSLSKAVKLNWTGPLWLALIPFLAHYMMPETGFAFPRLFRYAQRAWPTTIAASLLIYGGALHYLSLGFAGLPYPENFPLVGCRDLGQQIEQIENGIEKVTGAEPLVVGMDKYRTASLLAFYRPESAPRSNESAPKESIVETAGCHLFGGNSLMYRYWFPKDVGDNRVMILVSPKRGDLDGNHVRSRVQEMGDIQQLVVRKNETPVGRYFYVVVKGHSDGKDLLHPPAPLISRQEGEAAGGIENPPISLASLPKIVPGT